MLSCSKSIIAQEREFDLNSNPKLFMTSGSANTLAKISATYKNYIIFLKDTESLNLPFVDDFSSNKFTSYKISDYSTAAISKVVRYSFKVNGNVLDSIIYITDTAYTYTWDGVTNKLDSIKKVVPDFIITLYEDIINPTQITSTFDAWIPYFKPVYDTLADTIKFEFLVSLDTIRRLQIDSITFVDTHLLPNPLQPPLWYENEVFVNSNYPINPPSIGVATFDGLDSTGYPYNFVNPNAYGLADKLSSKYLDLSAPLGPNDSLIFSFFYQPKGLGNTPESTDSLILDFKANDGNWYHVWSSPGKPLNLLSGDTVFQEVTLRINDPMYLYDGFQFRFKNYATLSGNVDHWHLDYVRLKKITAPSDLIRNDIAFVYPLKSFLKDYEAVPYTQFDTSMMKTAVKNTIVNLNSAVLNYGFYSYAVADNYGTSIGSYSATVTTNIQPSYPSVGMGGNFVFPPATMPSVTFHYSDTLSSCRDFTIKQERAGTPDQIETNDKISYTQHITDYFAYDDASAESAYGLVQAGSQGALKFSLSKPDVLSGVYIYFNPTVDNATNKVFKLTVWDEIGGLPGNIIYQNPKDYSPSYARVIDGFYKLDLDTNLALPGGNFFIGWKQSTANELNIGLDKNNNNGDKMYYNIGGGWLQSIISGSLMIHPVFSSCPNLYIGVNERKKKIEESLTIYPNPAQEYFFIKSKIAFDAQITLMDLSGKTVLRKAQNTNNAVDLTALQPGVYFVQIENKQDHTLITKKIVLLK
jgi:hypothetical protein